MHALKWWNLHTRMFFAPEGAGGGSEAPSSPAGGGGDLGGASGGASAPPSSPSPDGGGGATTPSAAPASPEPTSAPEGFDWSALGSLDDLDHVEIPPAVKPAEKPPVVAPPVTPAAVPPAPQAPQVPQPGAPRTPQPKATAPPLSASDPVGIATGIEANRDAIIAHLAQAKFALSEDDIKDLDTDVTVAVPKLLARVFVESQVSMQKFLAQAVPGMMQKYNRVTSANDEAEKQFFDTHKALDRNNPQHRQAAARMATVYRQANPGIPLGQLIQEVGPMVMAALRLGAVAPASGGTPLPRGGVPFTPAVNGGGGVSPTPEPQDEWAGLGRNYD